VIEGGATATRFFSSVRVGEFADRIVDRFQFDRTKMLG
jgi:hypothetical protein